MSQIPDWAKTPIKNVLLDINGVLFNSGEYHPIKGSVEAMQKLSRHGLNFCLVTNECTTPKRLLAQKLNDFGFDFIRPGNIVSPAPVACRFIEENKLNPRLHVCDNILPDFQPTLDRLSGSKEKPDCLVVGDVMDKLSRDFIDESLQVMLESSKPIKILSLGVGRYYRDAQRIRMDTGAYVAAFEFCLGVDSTNFGKPTKAFFLEALEVVGGTPEDTIMIGDDVVSDVGGAQKLGMRSFLVRTGKYRKSDETGQGVIPHDVFDDLEHAINSIVSFTKI